MIAPCGIATPPYGCTVVLPSVPGLTKSQTSVMGCVLHPDRMQMRMAKPQRFMVSIRDVV
jgi:hypothetical protein